MRLSLKVRKSTIPMTLCCTCIVLLLLSEVSFYLRLTPAGLFPGLVKTVFYAVILCCAIWVLLKNSKMDVAIGIFLLFTTVTLVSTAIGVRTDIAVWRQLVHLTFFAASFVVSFYTTYRLGLEEVSSYLKYAMALFVVIFALALPLKGLQTQNAIYYLLMFLPTLAFAQNRIAKLGISGFIVFAVLMSNKRTVLVTVLAYFFVCELLSNQKQTRRKLIGKIIIYSLVCIGVYALYPVVLNELNITVFDELQISHIIEDGGSNRLFIYGMLWNTQKMSDLRHWLIGDGYNAVLFSQVCRDGPFGVWVSAHNDYLEVLFDYGIVGLLLYISFLGALLRKGRKMIRMGCEYGIAFVGSIVMVLLISLASHLIIYLNYYVIFFVFWGMCLADYHKRVAVGFMVQR